MKMSSRRESRADLRSSDHLFASPSVIRPIKSLLEDEEPLFCGSITLSDNPFLHVLDSRRRAKKTVENAARSSSLSSKEGGKNWALGYYLDPAWSGEGVMTVGTTLFQSGEAKRRRLTSCCSFRCIRPRRKPTSTITSSLLNIYTHLVSPLQLLSRILHHCPSPSSPPSFAFPLPKLHQILTCRLLLPFLPRHSEKSNSPLPSNSSTSPARVSKSRNPKEEGRTICGARLGFPKESSSTRRIGFGTEEKDSRSLA